MIAPVDSLTEKTNLYVTKMIILVDQLFYLYQAILIGCCSSGRKARPACETEKENAQS